MGTTADGTAQCVYIHKHETFKVWSEQEPCPHAGIPTYASGLRIHQSPRREVVSLGTSQFSVSSIVAQPRAAYLPTWPADASASQRNFFHQRRRRSAAATDGRRAEEKTRLSDAPASSSSLPWNAPIQQQCAVASCADISSSDGTRRAFSSAAPANIGGPACLYRFPLSRVARHIIEPRAAEPLLRALLRAARPGRRRHLHRLGLFDGKRASRPGQAARIQRTSLCNLIGCLHVDRLQRNTYTRARIVAYPRTLCMYVRWRKCARGSGCRIRKPAAVGHVKPVVSAVATQQQRKKRE